MSKEILIASDSTADLSPELRAKYGVETLPLGITLGSGQYLDGVNIDPDGIYAHYQATKELPKTSAINAAEFASFFRRHTREGKAIVFFTISSDMSSTYNNAYLAAEEFEDVYVVDTRSLSTGGGLLVLKACELAAGGMSARETALSCAALAPLVSATFVVDDLEFLHKGGRCSALTALGANMLQIKPCIAVRDGRMGVDAKYRGKFQSALKKYIQAQLADASGIDLSRAFLTHAGCSEELVAQCAEQVRELAPFEEVIVTRAGCTVSAHCGRNTLGVLFMRRA